MIVHAGLVARWTAQGWRGVLIEGAAGSGKSDLALRLLQIGWGLVADDRVVLWRSGDRLFGRAPDTLCRLIEVRGVGVLAARALPLAEVVLALRHAAEPERAPEPQVRSLAGVTVPALALNLLQSGTPARLTLALTQPRSRADATPDLESRAGERI